MNESDTLGNDVFELKEQRNKYLIELQDLLQEINENAKIKLELTEFNKLTLEQECKSVNNAYQEMVDLRATKEKLYAEKKRHIETLNMEKDNEEFELHHLKSRERDLMEQRVTEEEYKNMLHTLETLRTESEMLNSDDLNIEDGLVLKNEALVYITECSRILSEYECNFQNARELINKESELKAITNTVEKLQTEQLIARQQKLEQENNFVRVQADFSSLQNEYMELKYNYANTFERVSKKVAKARSDTENKFQTNIDTIVARKETISKLEEDLKKMRQAFIHNYAKISSTEKRVVDKFKQAMVKFGPSD